MRVELGSGYRATSGWLHVDMNWACRPDTVADVRALPFGDCTVSKLRAVDVLEHLSYWDTPATLTEWARVLVPGGHLFVQVPDAEAVMQRAVGFDTAGATYGNEPDALAHRPDMVKIAWRLLGGHADGIRVHAGDDWRWNAHYSLFSHDSLREELRAVGLVPFDMRTNQHPNIQCKAVKV